MRSRTWQAQLVTLCFIIVPNLEYSPIPNGSWLLDLQEYSKIFTNLYCTMRDNIHDIFNEETLLSLTWVTNNPRNSLVSKSEKAHFKHSFISRILRTFAAHPARLENFTLYIVFLHDTGEAKEFKYCVAPAEA